MSGSTKTGQGHRIKKTLTVVKWKNKFSRVMMLHTIARIITINPIERKSKMKFMKDVKQRSKPLNKKTDLQDSPEDAERLQNEETTIDLPDVKDIPGQEHINVPNMNQFKDTTTSSDDEEGKDVWTTELLEDDVITDQSSNVTPLEKEMLDLSANDMPTRDDQQLRRATLDNTDNDGDQLNEKGSADAISGSDLDVPGADDDNMNESIGEEDEENNSYSLGGDEKSLNEERSGT